MQCPWTISDTNRSILHFALVRGLLVNQERLVGGEGIRHWAVAEFVRRRCFGVVLQLDIERSGVGFLLGNIFVHIATSYDNTRQNHRHHSTDEIHRSRLQSVR